MQMIDCLELPYFGGWSICAMYSQEHGQLRNIEKAVDRIHERHEISASRNMMQKDDKFVCMLVNPQYLEPSLAHR